MSPTPPEPAGATGGDLASFLEALYHRRAAGIKLGLETTRALLAALGDPHRTMPCIHVAGTNGKGSVCAMLEAILRAAGLRTGLYLSPHLIRFNERFQVNGQPISDDALHTLLTEVDLRADRLAELPEGHPPTFFEFTTAAAFSYFAQCGVDIGVIETGLGGRLDSTNLVDPLAAVITTIGIDHIGYLGSELEQIAREKAGIIKPGRPVVCGDIRDPAWTEIQRVARSRGAPWVRADECVSVRRLSSSWEGQRIEIETGSLRYPRVRFPLLGSHQLANLAVCVAVIETLTGYGALHISPSAVRRGLETVRWPGRGQRLHRNPLILLDVAHNADGATALRVLLDELAPHTPIAVVAGFSEDRDTMAFFRALSGRVQIVWTVSFSNPRSKPAEVSAEEARRAGVPASPSTLAEAVPAAVGWARERSGAVVITGSIYLAGDALQVCSGLGLAADNPSSDST